MRRNRRIAKKGQLEQVAVIMGVLIVLAFVSFIVIKVNSNFFAALDESGMTTTYPEVAALKGESQNFASYFDWGMLALFIGLSVGLIWTTWLIPSHPVFMVVNIIGVFILALVAMAVSNMFGEAIAGEGEPFGEEANQMPITVWVVQYLPYVVVALIFISTIVMFSKGQSQGAGYQ